MPLFLFARKSLAKRNGMGARPLAPRASLRVVRLIMLLYSIIGVRSFLRVLYHGMGIRVWFIFISFYDSTPARLEVR